MIVEKEENNSEKVTFQVKLHCQKDAKEFLQIFIFFNCQYISCARYSGPRKKRVKTELAKPVVEYVNNAFIKVDNYLENQCQCVQCVKILTKWHITLTFEKVGLW